jgi:hypothetical protein
MCWLQSHGAAVCGDQSELQVTHRPPHVAHPAQQSNSSLHLLHFHPLTPLPAFCYLQRRISLLRLQLPRFVQADPLFQSSSPHHHLHHQHHHHPPNQVTPTVHFTPKCGKRPDVMRMASNASNQRASALPSTTYKFIDKKHKNK